MKEKLVFGRKEIPSKNGDIAYIQYYTTKKPEPKGSGQKFLIFEFKKVLLISFLPLSSLLLSFLRSS